MSWAGDPKGVEMFAFMPSMGPVELLLVAGSALLLFASIGLAVWGIADAASRDEKQWRAAGVNRGLWIALMAGGTFLCYPLGLIFAVYYLATVRKQLGGVSV